MKKIVGQGHQEIYC